MTEQELRDVEDGYRRRFGKGYPEVHVLIKYIRHLHEVISKLEKSKDV